MGHEIRLGEKGKELYILSLLFILINSRTWRRGKYIKWKEGNKFQPRKGSEYAHDE